MMTANHNLRECDRGASVIEFALAAPFLAALLLGIIELSRAYSDRLQLEQAAQRTVERVQQQRTASADYSWMRTEAALAAEITATNNNPTVTQWLECTPTDGNGTPTGAAVHQGADSLGQECPSDTDLPARYVSISIQKTFNPIVATRYLGANADGTYTLTGEAGIRIQ
jgi:Flp pilus assembly protein TadG